MKKLLSKITESKVVKSTVTLIKKHKKIVKGVLISLCTLFVIYIGMALYFMNHFYFGSTINCISVSGKSVDTVNELMASELHKYELKLKERGNKNEKIKADNIGLKYDLNGDFRSIKDKQNPFKWLSAIFSKENCILEENFQYDKNLLLKCVNNLSCFDNCNIIEPKNPTFKFTDKGYEIVPEINGNKIKKYILYIHIADSILDRKTSLNLESINCYVKPQYTSTSKKILDTKNILNKYAASKITYTFGKDQELLDGTAINEWLSVDENIEVNLDEKKVKNYIDSLAKSYNTVGKKRNFVTSLGKSINLGGGDYGWSIDKTKETQALIESIKIGETITKEPAYTQTALSPGKNDIGNTYVEINLTSQHLWFYKNGSLISEGPIVTGNVSANHRTPPGIYKLKYKQKNAVLRGADYAAPVTFWMPFNGGIGIHDASWRSSFGGNIYRTNGSHGCINSPYYLAKAIFNNVKSGIPVICYN